MSDLLARTRACPWCGRPLTTTNARAIYDTAACRTAVWRLGGLRSAAEHVACSARIFEAVGQRQDAAEFRGHAHRLLIAAERGTAPVPPE